MIGAFLRSILQSVLREVRVVSPRSTQNPVFVAWIEWCWRWGGLCETNSLRYYGQNKLSLYLFSRKHWLRAALRRHIVEAGEHCPVGYDKIFWHNDRGFPYISLDLLLFKSSLQVLSCRLGKLHAIAQGSVPVGYHTWNPSLCPIGATLIIIDELTMMVTFGSLPHFDQFVHPPAWRIIRTWSSTNVLALLQNFLLLPLTLVKKL